MKDWKLITGIYYFA